VFENRLASTMRNSFETSEEIVLHAFRHSVVAGIQMGVVWLNGCYWPDSDPAPCCRSPTPFVLISHSSSLHLLYSANSRASGFKHASSPSAVPGLADVY